MSDHQQQDPRFSSRSEPPGSDQAEHSHQPGNEDPSATLANNDGVAPGDLDNYLTFLQTHVQTLKQEHPWLDESDVDANPNPNSSEPTAGDSFSSLAASSDPAFQTPATSCDLLIAHDVRRTTRSNMYALDEPVGTWVPIARAPLGVLEADGPVRLPDGCRFTPWQAACTYSDGHALEASEREPFAWVRLPDVGTDSDSTDSVSTVLADQGTEAVADDTGMATDRQWPTMSRDRMRSLTLEDDEDAWASLVRLCGVLVPPQLSDLALSDACLMEG